jgi:hypothetical protein
MLVTLVLAMVMAGDAAADHSVFESVYLTGDEPFVRVNTADKLLMLSGGHGTQATGGMIALRGALASFHKYCIDFYAGNALRMHIAQNGYVGIGTDNPQQRLHVVGNIRWGDHGSFLSSDQGGSIKLGGTGTPYIDFRNDMTSDHDVRLRLASDDVLLLEGGYLNSNGRPLNSPAFYCTGTNGRVARLVPYLGANAYNPLTEAGDVGLFFSDGAGFVIAPHSSAGKGMRLDPYGNLGVTGTLTTGSSRDLKNNIDELSGEEAVEALMSLVPVKYNYKTNTEELELGFIAEDVPELVARNDRKSLSPMDFAALSVSVIQELKRENENQQRQITELKALVVQLVNSR